MYVVLKVSLVKAIKYAKAGGVGNAGWENTQLERIERLIRTTELSQGQVTQLLEQLRKQMTLPGVQSQREQAIADKYNSLLKQLAGRLEIIDKDNRQTYAMMEQMKKDEAIHVIDYKGILTFRLK